VCPAVTHGWRWYKVKGNKLLSPLVGNLELPRDGVLDRAYFIPGAQEMYWTAFTQRYDLALTYGLVEGPFTLDDSMPRTRSMRSTRYRAQIILADNPLRLQPFYDLPLMENDFQLSTMLAVEQMFAPAVPIVAGRQVASTTSARPLHITFVCSYNVGRSVMAAAMFAQQLRERGLADAVRVSSAGTANYTYGSPMDALGAEVLRGNGYAVPDHRSKPVNHATAAGADLAVVMQQHHATALRHLGVPANKVRLLRSFDPNSPHAELKNPYTADDFRYCFTVIEAALPGLHAWVGRRLGTDAASVSPVSRTGRERMGAAR
jgi:protein-tyrosine phosphatase